MSPKTGLLLFVRTNRYYNLRTFVTSLDILKTTTSRQYIKVHTQSYFRYSGVTEQYKTNRTLYLRVKTIDTV